MFLVRLAKGDAAPATAVLTSVAVVLLMIFFGVFFEANYLLHLKFEHFVRILLLIYCSFGVMRCSKNAKHTIVRGFMVSWALTLDAMLFGYIIILIGAPFGLIVIAGLIVWWKKCYSTSTRVGEK